MILPHDNSIMAEVPSFRRLIEEITTLKLRLENSRTKAEKLMILTELRFLLDAVDAVIREHP